MVSVNDKHFCTFTYRIPLDRCKFVEAHGEVTIDNVEVKEISQYAPETLKNELFAVPFEENVQNDEKLVRIELYITVHLSRNIYFTFIRFLRDYSIFHS